MKGIDLLRTLQKINKPFYTISDLEKVTALSRDSLYVALKRWLAAGILERATSGIYLPIGSTVPLENVAAQLYCPNYLSFESALAKYGVLNLVPFTITFATPRKTRKYTLRKQEVEFRQISPSLFFGFEMEQGFYIATPEKAFLDQVYLLARGKTQLDLDEIDTGKLSIKNVNRLSKQFPAYVQKHINKIITSRGRNA